jgi:hypothetical protein
MLRALLIGFLAAMGGLGTTTATAQDQRADPDFDTKVASPTYKSRHPAVLFDEAHHNFHTAGGLYKPFADLIRHDGYRVESNKKPLSRALLDRYEILIIANAEGAKEEAHRTGAAQAHPVDVADPGGEEKEPQAAEVRVKIIDIAGPGVEEEGHRAAAQALRDVECKVVGGWVKSGGSLLLITDMNQWGAAARNLADRFGVAMSQGVTIDPRHCVDGTPARLIFTDAAGLLGDHPITRGRDPSERINRVVTYVGQSLLGPPRSVPFLRLSNSAIDEDSDGGRVGAAGRCQGLAMIHGKGRVVVLGEAGALSAQLGAQGPFGMNDPGNDNRQLALNVMHWLSGALPADPRAVPASSDSPRQAPRPSLPE